MTFSMIYVITMANKEIIIISIYGLSFLRKGH